MLKYAGWDRIVIEGRADEPVWLDIRNEEVKIRNCSKLSLWSTDIRECQHGSGNMLPGIRFTVTGWSRPAQTGAIPPRGRVEVCPVDAIQFTAEVPQQEGDSGYKVNLRDSNWSAMGYPVR